MKFPLLLILRKSKIGRKKIPQMSLVNADYLRLSAESAGNIKYLNISRLAPGLLFLVSKE